MLLIKFSALIPNLYLIHYIRSLVAAMEYAKNRSENYALSLEEKVAERTQELHELSRRDGLTGLYNHRAFLQLLKKELSYAKRNNLPLSLIYFDVDNFKSVNDKSGHLRGDEILKSIGLNLTKITRDIDVPCRYGGDEFCVVLSGSTSEDAEKFCHRLTEDFSENHEDVTLSIGVAQTGPEDFDDFETLIKRADSSMYEAKKNIGFQIMISPNSKEK
ncbi:GGDEF domain-containing protein [Desulfobulbus sp. TB]|nr:GGDEF domain-containing protein [Desulfobulbus sp. TB]